METQTRERERGDRAARQNKEQTQEEEGERERTGGVRGAFGWRDQTPAGSLSEDAQALPVSVFISLIPLNEIQPLGLYFVQSYLRLSHGVAIGKGLLYRGYDYNRPLSLLMQSRAFGLDFAPGVRCWCRFEFKLVLWLRTAIKQP